MPKNGEGSFIFSKFLNLKPDKQMRIINAAIREFAQKGYENASTNQIVKEADISKGILFHYFKNKKDLFLFLYDFAVDTLKEDYFEKLDTTSRDIFERLRQVSVYKLGIVGRYPEIYNFLMAAHFEESAEVRHDIAKRDNELLAKGYGKVYENIDFSLFKEGVDIKKAIEIISWSVEGFAMKEQEKLKHSVDLEKDYQSILAGFDPYLDMLKKSFYK